MADFTAALVIIVWTLRAPGSICRRHDDRGEGVISAAIAVLIVAFLGVLMWVGFKDLWSTAKSKTDQQITQIGN
jgi:hypothetical protein